MLLLRVAVGRWAPLRSVLHPALWSVDREAALPSAFVRGAVRIEKVLAIASESKRGKKALKIEPHGIKHYLSVFESTRERGSNQYCGD